MEKWKVVVSCARNACCCVCLIYVQCARLMCVSGVYLLGVRVLFVVRRGFERGDCATFFNLGTMKVCASAR